MSNSKLQSLRLNKAYLIFMIFALNNNIISLINCNIIANSKLNRILTQECGIGQTNIEEECYDCSILYSENCISCTNEKCLKCNEGFMLDNYLECIANNSTYNKSENDSDPLFADFTDKNLTTYEGNINEEDSNALLEQSSYDDDFSISNSINNLNSDYYSDDSENNQISDSDIQENYSSPNISDNSDSYLNNDYENNYSYRPLNIADCDKNKAEGGDNCCNNRMYFDQKEDLCFYCSLYHYYCKECNDKNCLKCSNTKSEYKGRKCQEKSNNKILKKVLYIIILICIIALISTLIRRHNLLKKKNTINLNTKPNNYENNDINPMNIGNNIIYNPNIYIEEFQNNYNQLAENSQIQIKDNKQVIIVNSNSNDLDVINNNLNNLQQPGGNNDLDKNNISDSNKNQFYINNRSGSQSVNNEKQDKL